MIRRNCALPAPVERYFRKIKLTSAMGSLHDFAGAILATIFGSATVGYTALVATKRAAKRKLDCEAASAKLPLLQPWEVVTNEDLQCIAKCQALLSRTARPIYSDFLVGAILAYYDEHNETRLIEGVNSETSVLTSAICAERCALLQLRLKPSFRIIKAVYISTFSARDEAAARAAAAAPAASFAASGTAAASTGTLITPGLLCREMLSAYGPPDTRVVLFTHDWVPARDESGLCGGHSSRLDARGLHRVYRLGDLYPLPPVYNGVRRGDLPAFAATLAARAQPFAPPHIDARGFVPTAGSHLASEVAAASSAPGAEVGAGLAVVERALMALHGHIRAIAKAFDEADHLYPINLAAGVLFSDGTTVTAREDKGLEYGCTVEAPVKLCVALLAARKRGLRPLVMLVTDQYGTLHAPNARARSWLYERGFGATVVFAHDAAGALVRVTADRLSPAVPAIALGSESGGSGRVAPVLAVSGDATRSGARVGAGDGFLASTGAQSPGGLRTCACQPGF